ncbi:MAG TPA: hypothetical protein VGJ20_46450 [Xanthobacteraceae bacterium]|jgi:hypothetical protein
MATYNVLFLCSRKVGAESHTLCLRTLLEKMKQEVKAGLYGIIDLATLTNADDDPSQALGPRLHGLSNENRRLGIAASELLQGYVNVSHEVGGGRVILRA